VPKINKKTARRLANICLWAYDFDESSEKTRLNFDGEDPIQTIEVHDAQEIPTSFAGIVEYEKFVVIAFQGTITDVEFDGNFSFSTLKDWIQNFKVKQIGRSKTGLPGEVHFGFNKQLKLIYEQVKLKIPGGTKKPLILTGHSQGGAIAALATKKLQLDGFKIKQTCLFAAPRPGNKTFAKSITTPVFRVEFGHDLVPHVPPTLQHSGFFSKSLGLLASLIDLPQPLEALRKMISKVKSNSYHSVGELTYGNETGELLTNLDSKAETALFKKRRRKLLAAGKTLASHHGLANYIGMLS